MLWGFVGRFGGLLSMMLGLVAVVFDAVVADFFRGGRPLFRAFAGGSGGLPLMILGVVAAVFDAVVADFF